MKKKHTQKKKKNNEDKLNKNKSAARHFINFQVIWNLQVEDIQFVKYAIHGFSFCSAHPTVFLFLFQTETIFIIFIPVPKACNYFLIFVGFY